MKKRLLCVCLAVLLILPMLMQMPTKADAAHQSKTRAIGIVLDNSGSMYVGGNSSWCRATYAVEVFAAMMNEGDTVQVYPMCPCTLGENGPQVQSPLVIDGPDKADTIRPLFTPDDGDTPFGTVIEAYEGLKKTNADEKYLIVLTDGEFDNMKISEVSEKLDAYSQDMNVMYLAIGSSISLPSVSNSERQYYDKANDSGQTLSKLTAMCNRIFGRDELSVKGNKISFDVSMSKIIVFVQGENVTEVTVNGGTLVSQHATKYSERGSGYYENYPDTSLQGMLVTYENLDAGTYDLSYTGDASSVSVYYEADVDLAVQLLDASGAVVDPAAGVYSGEYSLAYSLVDKYGQPTTSDLLGDVQYEITYSVNGKGETVEAGKPGAIPITLEAGAVLDGDFKVTYLDDYTIEKDAAALGWPAGGIAVGTRPVGEVVMELTGGLDVYKLSELEEQAIYQVTIFCEGQQLTGKDLDNTTLSVDIENGNVKPDIQKTDDGYEVTLRYNGEAANTQCGDQCALFTAGYTNVDGQVGYSGTIPRDYTIEDDSNSLKVELDLAQDYYLISQIETSKPIIAKLSAGGAPLTQELFDAATVDVQIDGMEFTLTPNPADSSYEIKLLGGENIRSGTYTVDCTVNGVDVVGRASSDTDSAQFECQNYPAWVRWVFWGLLILLLLLLIWLFLNAKVLPKRIVIERCTFRVGNKEVTGDAECNFSGGGKKRGFLEINPPYFAGAPTASSCGIQLELVAVSPRRTPSSKRYIGIRGAVAGNEMYTTRMKFGGTTLVKGPEGDFVRMGTAKDVTIEENVDSGCGISVYADVPGPRSRKVNVALDSRLQFY